MSGFPGVKKYQDYCRKAVIRDGYILMNPVTGHRSHIQDWEELKDVRDAMKHQEFFAYIDNLKKYDKSNPDLFAYRNYMKRKSDLEKNSINYRIQNRGACCFKLSGIMFFNYLKKNKLLNIVKICVPAHDKT